MRVSAVTLSRIALTMSVAGAGMASAQEFRATITGRVTDPNGLTVPGATISAANSQTGEIAVGTTVVAEEGRTLAKACGVATQDTSGLTACFDLISTLERELRTAKALRDELAQLDSATLASPATVRKFCRQLLDDAVEVVQATATVQDEVCGLTSGIAIGRAAGLATHQRR